MIKKIGEVEMKDVISGPFRWTGSKKKLLNEMLESFDKKKCIYVEPFLGSGIVMLNVINQKKYDKIYVNDINENIIDFYLQIQNNLFLLLCEMEKIADIYNGKKSLKDKETYYYEMRRLFNENSLNKSKKCAMFWFLMKTGFNGVYRVNSKNKFNVPFGQKEKINFDVEQYTYMNRLIKNVHFYCESYNVFFEKIQKEINFNDCFIYCDPPYLPETASTINHTLYTKEKFYHKEFVEYLSELKNKNDISLMISMSESAYGNLLYGSGFYVKPLSEIVRTVNPKRIVKSKEVAYTNYLLEIENDAYE